MGKTRQHIVPHNSGWSVRRAGAARASRVFPTQHDAIRYAESLVGVKGGEIYVHRRDGTIRERDTYGADPTLPDRRH